MRLPISPRITKPSSDEPYRQKSCVNTIRLSYENNNQYSGRRLSSGSGSSGRLSKSTIDNSSNRRFIPNVNSPTWRSIQGVMKSKVNSIASPRHYASSPRHVAKYKMSSPSPRGRGGSGFFVDNNKVSSSTQELGTTVAGVGVGGVDSYSLTAASTNSVDELEVKFSGGSSLDDDDDEKAHCNNIEDCNTEARDEEVVDYGHNKVFDNDDGEMRDVSLVEMRSAVEQSEEEVSLVV